MLDLSKVKENEAADLGAIETLEIVLGWDQPKAGGMFGRLKDKLNETDVDVTAIVYEGTSAVDYVDPKAHPYALGGAVVHAGDVKRGTGEDSGETITAHLSKIRASDADIDGIAFVASCAKGGFDRIAGAVCRVYSGTGAGRQHLGNIRFDVTTSHTGALLAVVRKTATGWEFTRAKAYGPGEGGWRSLAGLARNALTA